MSSGQLVFGLYIFVNITYIKHREAIRGATIIHRWNNTNENTGCMPILEMNEQGTHTIGVFSSVPDHSATTAQNVSNNICLLKVCSM